MFDALRRIWRPAVYQGGRASRRYFEGWYFKHVSADEQSVIAVIPGVSFSQDGRKNHAFVQVMTGDGVARYYSYPAQEFEPAPGTTLALRIGGNRFDRDGISLELDGEEGSVRGSVSFGPWAPWPVRALSPGAMGWYRFVPRMETYHAVLSMDHALSGWLEVDGARIDLDGGRGYIEKDWGHSFPSSWVWAQSNHFGEPGTSVMASVAKIPWMGSSFVGHIAGLWLEGELHRFATYTGARLVEVETRPSEARIVLSDRREELELHLRGTATATLKAPVLGAMEGRDAESLGGTIEVTLRELRGGHARVAFSDVGRQAAVEVMNDRDELGAGVRRKR